MPQMEIGFNSYKYLLFNFILVILSVQTCAFTQSEFYKEHFFLTLLFFQII